MGSPVWSWKGRPTEGHPEPVLFYASQIANSYFLVCNSFQVLKNVAEKLTPATKVSTTLAKIQDWDLVGTHDIWGYRRYRFGPDVNRTASGLIYVSPRAQALSFYVEIGVLRKKAFLRVLDSTTEGGTPVHAQVQGNLPKFQRISPGVWQSAFPLAGDEVSNGRTVLVMFMFGIGFYV